MIAMRPDHRNRTVFITIDQSLPRFRNGLRGALKEIGKENSKHNKMLIKNPPKTGRIYKFQGRDHQASAPGQPPADRSGDLRKTSGYRVYGHSRMEFGDRMSYGKYLEDGTSRMKARPHIKRTVREKQRDNFTTLANTVHRELVRP